MTDVTKVRPDETEYVPEYVKYVSLVPEGNILNVLIGQMDETTALLLSIPEERAGFRYAPDKWSIKELVGHLIDSERIFSYRALRFARDDKTALPGYEQDDYVRDWLLRRHRARRPRRRVRNRQAGDRPSLQAPER